MRKYIEKEIAQRIISQQRSKEQMLLALDGIADSDVRMNVYAHWIPVSYYRPSTGQYDIRLGRCSACGYECSRDLETGKDYHDHAFCPKCGAVMQEK